jgi:hypothetical protein
VFSGKNSYASYVVYARKWKKSSDLIIVAAAFNCIGLAMVKLD